MTTTLDELVTPMTVAEAQAAIYSALAARGVSTTAWKPGAVVRTIVAALAIMLAALSSLQATIAKSGFLDFAEGDWLTLLGRYVYGVERDLGAFASGSIQATNSTGSIYAGDAGDLIVLNPTSGKTYRNTAAFSIGSMAFDVDIPVEAVEIGTESTSTGGTITDLVTTLNGVTITNASALVGADEESDALLRLRCRESLGRLSPNGPKDAYAYFARSTLNAAGESIGVTRVRAVPDGFGALAVYVATASGGVSGTSGDPDTDLGAIQVAFDEEVEPIGITATATTAVALAVNVTCEVWVPSTIGMTEAEVVDAIETGLATYLSAQPIGGALYDTGLEEGYVFTSGLEGAIDRSLSSSPVKRIVTVPAADVVVAIDEAPVVGTVTVTAVHFVTEDIY